MAREHDLVDVLGVGDLLVDQRGRLERHRHPAGVVGGHRPVELQPLGRRGRAGLRHGHLALVAARSLPVVGATGAVGAVVAGAVVAVAVAGHRRGDRVVAAADPVGQRGEEHDRGGDPHRHDGEDRDRAEPGAADGGPLLGDAAAPSHDLGRGGGQRPRVLPARSQEAGPGHDEAALDPGLAAGRHHDLASAYPHLEPVGRLALQPDGDLGGSLVAQDRVQPPPAEERGPLGRDVEAELGAGVDDQRRLPDTGRTGGGLGGAGQDRLHGHRDGVAGGKGPGGGGQRQPDGRRRPRGEHTGADRAGQPRLVDPHREQHELAGVVGAVGHRHRHRRGRARRHPDGPGEGDPGRGVGRERGSRRHGDTRTSRPACSLALTVTLAEPIGALPWVLRTCTT
ncbi:hypothetical protein [Nocardioides sp. TF02-7]|uniref:hypothetical protein n=1 Tax=Nocardioides sp. TF02-7 TaxID=2917724 RepID=UPI001F063EFD|nr:hypothetical protein [Nocardioides sp. TF02-7]UMG91035.1 hypothetical protein MF408_12445 [Nocardioides sp. TF02-7]